ncbi:hypothetical protein BW727_101927 [Jeotgalibaca dankookensis]|uniref:Uncharacterized protein n=1 Tax=Jeotgalibaca dankookensis TaxID=708126 RepID=A0A1S6IRS1_9LACT|nr:hypothetical protein [Jeotgalibaca dankookensis]AQS54251.1 hypothetical protein BW727_101927 [Jeotgalibaca dankookensis]
MRRRTGKIFSDYNDYHDRGMMKWMTAYAMDELVVGIEENKAEAVKDLKQLPQMNPEEINQALITAYHTKYPLIVQLNQKDEWGRQTDTVRGLFLGYLPDGKIKLTNCWINIADIRSIQVDWQGKWSQVENVDNHISRTEKLMEADNEFIQDDCWIE